jgi:hypothetical protein
MVEEGKEEDRGWVQLARRFKELTGKDLASYEGYFAQGFKPLKRTWSGKSYISIKRGRRERVIGPYSDELWELVQSIYEKCRSGQFTPLEGSKLEDEQAQVAIAGPTEGMGYLQELKDMIRAEIGRTRELTEAFYDYGISVLLAALSKTGTSMEEFRKVAKGEVSLKTALSKAAETVFKALDLYQSDVVQRFEERIRALEEERDEARATYAHAVAKMKELARVVERFLEPLLRFERLIIFYLASCKVNANVLAMLLDKWLERIAKVGEELKGQITSLLAEP